MSENETREALETLRRLVVSVAPEPSLATTRETGEAYRRGFADGQARAVNFIDSALACYPLRHAWHAAKLVTAGTGEITDGPFAICSKCRLRSDANAPLNCTPLPPDVLARWEAADEAFAMAQQAMQVARQAAGR
jgi:hypothetical protein